MLNVWKTQTGLEIVLKNFLGIMLFTLLYHNTGHYIELIDFFPLLILNAKICKIGNLFIKSVFKTISFNSEESTCLKVYRQIIKWRVRHDVIRESEGILNF